MSLQLIYRGEVYTHTPSIRPYCQPRAVNWRFRAADETVVTSCTPVAAYLKPRAVNWRYQLVTEAH